VKSTLRTLSVEHFYPEFIQNRAENCIFLGVVKVLATRRYFGKKFHVIELNFHVIELFSRLLNTEQTLKVFAIKPPALHFHEVIEYVTSDLNTSRLNVSVVEQKFLGD
jgi:hypothetical protein